MAWGTGLDVSADAASNNGPADIEDQKSATEPAPAEAAAVGGGAVLVTPRLPEPLLRRTLHTLLANWEVGLGAICGYFDVCQGALLSGPCHRHQFE